MVDTAKRRRQRIWVTRPKPDADVFADQLRARGFDPIVAPLVEMQTVALDREQAARDLRRADIIVITSRNGVRAASDVGLEHALAGKRIIAVGPGTAQLLRELGAGRGAGAVIESGGQAADIVADVSRSPAPAPGTRRQVAYLRGREVAFDLTAALSDPALACAVTPIVVYEIRETMAPDAGLADEIRAGGIDGVVLFSPRVASVYARVVAGCGLGAAVSTVAHYCLSERVAARISHLQLERVGIPNKPNVQEMLELMGGPAAQSVH